MTLPANESAPTGLFKLSRKDIPALRQAAEQLNQAYFQVDLRSAKNVPSFIKALKRDLDFPDWFGGNLDALHDCLTDFSWHEAPGYVLLIRGADRLHADESAFAALNAVFADAADYWREDGVPFWVFYDLRADGLATLPTVA